MTMNCLIKSEPQSSTGQPTQASATLRPVADIIETKESYVLELEMPGVNKSGLEVTLENNILTIFGLRTSPGLQGSDFLHKESRDENFKREFLLDPTIDAKHIQVRIEQGVASLVLPKAEAVKPRRIDIGE